MAYGTESIARVEKVVGPGNAYVASAKRQVYGDVALDLVAGPSEVLVIADSTARPAFVAADLLAQAEHGSGREGAVLVTTSEHILTDTERELKRQTADLPAKPAMERVLQENTWLILAKDLTQAAAIANRYAPEHLEVMTDAPDKVAAMLTTAGAVFLGHWTPESCGDFVAGPSHVLPTGGTARFCSGLTVEQFYRRLSLVRYGEAALAREKDAIMTFAEVEELPAHGRCASVRLGPGSSSRS
jgi:histidinol dehydrogenase